MEQPRLQEVPERQRFQPLDHKNLILATEVDGGVCIVEPVPVLYAGFPVDLELRRRLVRLVDGDAHLLRQSEVVLKAILAVMQPYVALTAKAWLTYLENLILEHLRQTGNVFVDGDLHGVGTLLWNWEWTIVWLMECLKAE